jgi:hypothetical protein
MVSSISWHTYNVAQSVVSEPSFRKDMSPLLCLPPAFTLVSCSASSSTLKIEATYSSETSVDFQRATQRYIPGERTLYCLFLLIFTLTLHSHSHFSFPSNLILAAYPMKLVCACYMFRPYHPPWLFSIIIFILPVPSSWKLCWSLSW